MADNRITVRLPGGLRERIRGARGGRPESEFVISALVAMLDDAGPGLKPPAANQPAVTGLLAGLPVTTEIPAGGIPSPGVACSWARCWSRDTRRYGAERAELDRGGYRDQAGDEDRAGHPLCQHHASRLAGFRYVRPTAAFRSQPGRQAGTVTA